MESKFGLAHVWQQGDWVTLAVALALLAMSITSWIVIIVKLLDLRRLRAQTASCQQFWRGQDFADGLSRLGADADNPFRLLAQAGRDATSHLLHLAGEAPAPLRDSVDVSEWITRALRNAIDDCTAQLQSRLSLLATIGSTAPFVGLFGTVWGIYHALMALGEGGSAGIEQVAGPIGEALIMTALGLAVAIPAVLGYNVLVRSNKRVLHRLNRFAHDLHAYFVTGARVEAGQALAAAV